MIALVFSALVLLFGAGVKHADDLNVYVAWGSQDSRGADPALNVFADCGYLYVAPTTVSNFVSYVLCRPKMRRLCSHSIARMKRTHAFQPIMHIISRGIVNLVGRPQFRTYFRRSSSNTAMGAVKLEFILRPSQFRVPAKTHAGAFGARRPPLRRSARGSFGTAVGALQCDEHTAGLV